MESMGMGGESMEDESMGGSMEGEEMDHASPPSAAGMKNEMEP
jgi:hypothetical protein